MDAHIQSAPFVYTNGNGNGNGRGNGNGNSPLLITGRAIAAFTNDGDASQRDAISAMLVSGEAVLISWMIAQASAVTLSTIARTYAAMRLTPQARLAAAIKENGLVAANGMSPGELDAFLVRHLFAVWNSIDASERVTAGAA